MTFNDWWDSLETREQARFDKHACAEAWSEALNSVASSLKMTDSELLLMAGEMTAQELRTVRAVLSGIAAKITRGGI